MLGSIRFIPNNSSICLLISCSSMGIHGIIFPLTPLSCRVTISCFGLSTIQNCCGLSEQLFNNLSWIEICSFNQFGSIHAFCLFFDSALSSYNYNTSCQLLESLCSFLAPALFWLFSLWASELAMDKWGTTITIF